MPVTKSQLKSIVKECLIEILSEGIGSSTVQISEAARGGNRQVVSKPSPSVSSVLQQNASKVKLQQQQQRQVVAIKEAIRREAGNNDVMADILADTAVNSLPAMLEGDRTRSAPLPPVGTVERVVASATPDQLFGEEAASKWAALAFMDPIKK